MALLALELNSVIVPLVASGSPLWCSEAIPRTTKMMKWSDVVPQLAGRDLVSYALRISAVSCRLSRAVVRQHPPPHHRR
jgi:hypothetical protein